LQFAILVPSVYLQHFALKRHDSVFLLQLVKDQVSHPFETTGKITGVLLNVVQIREIFTEVIASAHLHLHSVRVFSPEQLGSQHEC
jgi:hypothetical protein